MTRQTSLQTELQDQRTSGVETRSDMIDLGQLLGILWRGKLIITICTLAMLFTGGYYAYIVAEPSYRSTAVVMLNSREEQVVDLQGVIGGLSSDRVAVNTEVEVMRSRELLGRIVTEQGLTEDPEFNIRLQPPSLIDRLKVMVKSLIGQDVSPAVLSAEEEASRNMQATINGVLSALTIRNVSQTLVFQITIETSDARKSARIADAISHHYIRNQLDVKFQATEQAISWLTARVSELAQELEVAENKVKAFRAETDLISPDALLALEVQLKERREQLSSQIAVRDKALAELDLLRTASTREEQAAALNDTQLNQFLTRVSEAQIARAFDTRVGLLEKQLEAVIKRNELQASALEASSAELQQRIKGQSRDLTELRQLEREAESVRLLYGNFLNRLKETSVQQGIQQADSRVLSSAVVPGGAASPRKTMILAMSLFIGFVIGAALVVIRELRSDTFRNADALENLTGYQVMGQVPLIRSRKRVDVLQYLHDKPASAAAEAVRNLRTSVLLSDMGQSSKVIMVTSSVPGEGKTTLSLALVQNLARMGKKVLVIEGDIRRKAFSLYFGETGERPDLIAAAQDRSVFQDALYRNELLQADVLMAQSAAVNPADIFSSPEFETFLQEAREAYDYVVIDTAPILVVPDARILARYADARLVVVKWDRTSKQQVTDALKALESVNGPATGLVLNQISQRGIQRYGYGQSYGAYAGYGTKYYVD